MEEQTLSEKDSLLLIGEMIQKAKHSFHENGTSAILWGSVIAVCGLVSFTELYTGKSLSFDIWILTLVAIIPQVFITLRERKSRKVISHTEAALNGVWIIYGISIAALVFYFNTVPGVTEKQLAAEGVRLVEHSGNEVKPFQLFVPSAGSLLLMLYAIPTMATGIAHRFKPMIYGGLLCYVFFIISCFVPTTYDMLLNGLAGVFNWLLPGIILRNKYNREQKRMHV